MTLKRAALLCRVSTANQANDRQVAELTEFANSKGYTVEADDVYEDKISGFTRYQERPALIKLLGNIKSKQKEYSMVFVMEISRISRKPEEGQKILLEFSDLGIPVYVKNIQQCTHLEDGKRNPFFAIIYTLLQEFASSEAEYIRERSASGLRQKVKNGHAGSGIMLPYGYRRDEQKMLQIDEEEAQVIRDLFDYALKGYGNKTIIRILNESGNPTRTQKAIAKGTIVTKGTGVVKVVKETKHVRWEEGTIQHMLTNPIYKGERRWKGETIPAPKIIEPDLWEQVQKLRRSKFDRRCVEMRYMYLLKGLCVCGVCGRNYYGRYKPGGTDMYYQCSSRRSKSLVCGNTGVNIEAIESTVWDVIRDSYKMVEHLQVCGVKLQETKKKIEQLKEELKFTEASLSEAEKEGERVKTMFKRGIINEEDLIKEHERIHRSVEVKKGTVMRLQKQTQALVEHSIVLSNMDNYWEILKKVEMDRYQIAEVLNNVLEKVVVTAVSMQSNNYQYLLGIFIKNLEVPITVLMTTKQRNQMVKAAFIQGDIAKRAGQNRFKYIDGSMDKRIKYDKKGILLSSVDEIVEMIKGHAASEMAVVDVNKLQQNYSAGITLRINEMPVNKSGQWFSPVLIENIPRLIVFDEANAIEKVKAADVKMRRKKGGFTIFK